MTHHDSNGITTTQQLISGAIAGGVARGLLGPLDLIKIRYQLQPHRVTRAGTSGGTGGVGGGVQPQYRSLLGTIRTIIAEEGGITALWKGNLTGLIMVSSYGAVQYAAFHQFQTIIRPLASTTSSSTSSSMKSSVLYDMAGGAFAAMIATTATYPFDLARTRLAAQQANRLYGGLTSALRSMYKSGGIRNGLYSGYRVTLIGIVPYMACQFASYRVLKHALVPVLDHSASSSSGLGSAVWWTGAIGFTSGVLSKFIAMPFDVIKKRSQVASFAWEQTIKTTNTASSTAAAGTKPIADAVAESRRRLQSSTGGVWSIGRTIVESEGWRALWKGTAPSLLKAGPMAALTWAVYEACITAFTQQNRAKQANR